MKLTRRNALIGLGSLVAGSGALVGTGAFSSVEANRTVNIGSAGDTSALLNIESGSGASAGEITGTDSSGNVSQFQLTADDLNGDAVTEFNKAIKITNTGAEDVGLYVDNTPSNIGSGEELDIEKGVNNTTVIGSGNSVNVFKDGGAVELDVVVDLTGSNAASNIPDEITIVADQSQFTPP
jgi:hypothetical protein